MATNSYFNNYGSVDRVHGEQDLIEDLVIESIKMFGLDCFYIPRLPVSRDDIFQEDDLAQYLSAYPVEMYIKNVEGFEGEGDFLSKFGLEVRDSITFTVAQKRYRNAVSDFIDTADSDGDGSNDDVDRGTSRNHNVAIVQPSKRRPLEGDLLYFPLNKKIFEITFVEHEAVFYQMGSLQTFDLKCELFEYSQERFTIPEVPGVLTADQASAITDVFADHQLVNYAPAVIEFADGTPVNNTTFDSHTNSQNTAFEDFIDKDNNIAADNIIDFSQGNPFGDDIF